MSALEWGATGLPALGTVQTNATKLVERSLWPRSEMTNQKIFHNGIMSLLRMRMDALHYALLAVVVLLAVCTFGSFKEGAVSIHSARMSNS